MFRKLFTACAGVVLTAGFAFAGNVDGVYTCSNNGQNISVTLNSDGSNVTGQVSVNGSNLPLRGRESNGKIQGVWRNAKGQTIPFVAAEGANGLQLQTAGVTYNLSRNGNGAQPVAQPAAQSAPQMMDNTSAAAVPTSSTNTIQLQMYQGRCLQVQVPAGWTCHDSNAGVDAASPDNSIWVSRLFLRAMGRATPDMMVQRQAASWGRFGITNVQVVSQKNLSASSKQYELTFTFHGQPARGLIVESIQQGPNGFMSDMTILQATADKYEQCLPLMGAIAKSVRVTDSNTFVDNGKLNALAVKRTEIATKSAQDVGDIIINGENARSQVRDRTNLGADDTLRDVTRFQDPEGNQYTGPLHATRAFKHQDGTVTYTGDVTAPVPSDATEIPQFNYGGN